MTEQLIVYGATGYTGRLVAQALIARGIRPHLAARKQGPLAELAAELDCPYTAVSLGDGAGLATMLGQAKAVLHCAGPFMDTSGPMLRACLATGTHYVDITGEPPVFEACAAQNAAARATGIMVLAGGGFDVVPTDCVSNMLKQRMPDATHLMLAFASSGGVSRGTMRTSSRFLAQRPLVRRDGALVERDDMPVQQIDFGDGIKEVTATTWGDVVTAWHSTGIPNIEVFMAMPDAAKSILRLPVFVRRFLSSRWGRGIVEKQLRSMPPGPSAQVLATGRAQVYGMVRNAVGAQSEIRLNTPESYQLTAQGMAEIGARILADIQNKLHGFIQCFIVAARSSLFIHQSQDIEDENAEGFLQALQR